VTHQPLCKQAAIKGIDGIFYWDLNVAVTVTPGGVMPPQCVGNMRENYNLWYNGIQEQRTSFRSARFRSARPQEHAALAAGDRAVDRHGAAAHPRQRLVRAHHGRGAR